MQSFKFRTFLYAPYVLSWLLVCIYLWRNQIASCPTNCILESSVHLNFPKAIAAFLGSTIITPVINAKWPAGLHTKPLYFTLPESHLKQAVQNFQGILHELWRMKKIKGMQCTTCNCADMQAARETRRQFLMEMLAKNKNKNEKRIRDNIYQVLTLCWTLTQRLLT